MVIQADSANGPAPGPVNGALPDSMSSETLHIKLTGKIIMNGDACQSRD
jgi:hypothetical protein